MNPGGGWTCLAVLCSGLLSGAALADLRIGGEAGLGYDDNVGNAGARADVEAAGFVRAGAKLEWSSNRAQALTLSLAAGLDAEGYEHISRLSNGKAGLTARISWRPEGGFYTPTAALFAGLAYRQSASELRSGAEYRAGLFLSEQLTTRLSARVTVHGAQRVSVSDVFDLKSTSAGLDVDWSLTPRLALYSGYQFQYGKQVFTDLAPARAAAAAEVIEPDDAFGGSASGANAYRLRAHTQLASLGFNFALSPDYALDARVEHIEAGDSADNRYRRLIGTVSVLARF